MSTSNKTFNDFVKDIFAAYNTDNTTLLGRISEQIQWAWENWDFDYEDYSSIQLEEKPESYTDEFATEWIENEPFEFEISQYTEKYGEELDFNLMLEFLTK